MLYGVGEITDTFIQFCMICMVSGWFRYAIWMLSHQFLSIPIKLYRSVHICTVLAWFVQFLIRIVQFGCRRGIVGMYSEQFLVIFIDSGRIGVVWRHSDENLKKLYNFSELYSFGLELYSFYCPAHQNSTSLRVEGFRKWNQRDHFHVRSSPELKIWDHLGPRYIFP